MKKNSLLKLLGIAFVVAIVATGVFYGLFVNKLSSSTGSVKTMVVAARTLKPGAILKVEDVTQIPWFGPTLPKGAYEKPSEVAGSTVFDTIGQDEPVLASHLVNAQNGGSGVPPGMRAVSVHVTDSTGVLTLLHSGQKVDVQVVVGRGNNSDATLVRTALEDLQVLSVVPQPEQSSQGATLPVVTLLADPRQADMLAAADSGARVRLTLRNPLDDQKSRAGTLSLGAVMRATGAKSAQ
ncbi:MAG TPA: Flp pilus assembly protein CpaB [Bryobacteraceae bacterium]|jgi:Flp pilus assembly protein CpaB|nr:Flp pilus assembly protein CpaB [Bryobacteraceae bacterium]